MSNIVYVVQVKAGHMEPVVEAVFSSQLAAESSWAISYSRVNGELTFFPISTTETAVMYQAEGAEKPACVGSIYRLYVSDCSRHL